MSGRAWLTRIAAVIWVSSVISGKAQVVGVTAQLDANTITAGQSTMFHVYAQVLPAYRANAERIFSWNVDVMNTNGAVASANYAALVKPTSDKDPLTSSNGFNSGSDRLGIYDTFLNLPGAGTNPPVELMRFSVTGLAPGQTRLGVRAGTGNPYLSEDFIVAPLGGGGFLSGGTYSGSFAVLTVQASTNATINCLSITQTNLPGGLNQITLQYCPPGGYTSYVQYRNQLVGGPDWQSFPGGPHNSGLYRDTNNVPIRFYRIVAYPGP